MSRFLAPSRCWRRPQRDARGADGDRGGGGTGAALSARPAAAAGARARRRRAGCCSAPISAVGPTRHARRVTGRCGTAGANLLSRLLQISIRSRFRGRCTCAAAAGGTVLPGSSAFGQWAQRSAESGMRTTSSCTPVSTFVSLWPCITTSAPILQFFAFNSSEEEMCQHVPSASVAMPPLFIALRVVFFGAIFAFLNCSRPSS